MEKVERAVRYFEQGCNCAQAILAAYGEQFGLERETSLKLACGFGGGIQMGQTCGAVTGAFMVLGLKYGQTDAKDRRPKEKTYELISQFVEKFQSRNGSVVCKELLGCDISTPEGMKTARARNLFVSFCPKMVRDAAEILEQMLSESP
ncbi:MAG TPA: C-GCAxxG-C-C family protein [Sedimentisphaerales bacterium]|nr:C-GCAxxG-C-C family protein [Sedimentisphaerales bacterium]